MSLGNVVYFTCARIETLAGHYIRHVWKCVSFFFAQPLSIVCISFGLEDVPRDMRLSGCPSSLQVQHTARVFLYSLVVRCQCAEVEPLIGFGFSLHFYFANNVSISFFTLYWTGAWFWNQCTFEYKAYTTFTLWMSPCGGHIFGKFGEQGPPSFPNAANYVFCLPGFVDWSLRGWNSVLSRLFVQLEL